jgi:hypothetical protein
VRDACGRSLRGDEAHQLQKRQEHRRGDEVLQGAEAYHLLGSAL